MADWESRELLTSQLRAPRADDELPQPHRRRRNTKQWCRGKVGEKHQLGVRVKRNIASWRYPHDGESRARPGRGHCGWSWWAWRLYDDWYYSCGHEKYCTKCGKIFPIEGECPEYDQHPKPDISPQQAEEQHHALLREQRPQRGKRRR